MPNSKPEPPSNQPKVDNCAKNGKSGLCAHWENPRICATCTYFFGDTADPITPGCPACAMKEHTRGEYHRACTLYSPKKTD